MSVKLKDDLATFLRDRGNQIILSSCDISCDPLPCLLFTVRKIKLLVRL